jgi:hypothetical protein
LFEQAIRRMANRIADIAELSPEQLMRLEADDIHFDGLSSELLTTDGDARRFRCTCPGCKHESKAKAAFLGEKVRCPKCQHDFLAEWGEVWPDAAVTTAK